MYRAPLGLVRIGQVPCTPSGVKLCNFAPVAGSTANHWSLLRAKMIKINNLWIAPYTVLISTHCHTTSNSSGLKNNVEIFRSVYTLYSRAFKGENYWGCSLYHNCFLVSLWLRGLAICTSICTTKGFPRITIFLCNCFSVCGIQSLLIKVYKVY